MANVQEVCVSPGRTSLAGEGLQHQDGHSHLISATVPNCVSYDPAFAYELAVIIHDGLRRMYQEGEKVFYYITVMNENYTHPEMPKNAQDGILRGMYKLSKARKKADLQLLGSGTILREVIEAADILKKNHKIVADIWSVTSFNELSPLIRKQTPDHRIHSLAPLPKEDGCAHLDAANLLPPKTFDRQCLQSKTL